MGKSDDWQKDFSEKLDEFDIDIYNPRRTDWDSSWKQSIENKNFSDQVNWELDHIDKSDIVVFNFLGDSQSPITLMELGYVVQSDKQIIVLCGEKFWRKGNIEIICDRNNIPLFTDEDKFIEYLKYILSED